jgi:hypothetical protein
VEQAKKELEDIAAILSTVQEPGTKVMVILTAVCLLISNDYLYQNLVC